MPELKVQLLRGDKVDADASPRVDYQDALPQNMTGVVRQIFDIQGYMLQQPGLTAFTTGIGNDRGGVWNLQQNKHFRMSGNAMIEVDSDGTVTVLGYSNGTEQVVMPYSFNTQALISDGKYYLYDAVNGFRRVLDVDLGVPIDATWIDGYYVFTDGTSLYHTDISDESSIDPLQYATSEFSPDSTTGVGKTTDNKLIAFNRTTIEFFANQANTEFAFTRLPSRAVKYGCISPALKCEIGGTWYFIGGPERGAISIYELGIGQAIEIASREVTERLQEYDEDDLALLGSMESRIYNGYPAIIVHLPNETLYYSIKLAAFAGNEMAWSTLTSEGGVGWRAINGVFDPNRGEWVYGDKVSSRIGILDATVATHYGNPVECYLYTPFMYLETASIDEIMIETIPGFNTEDDASVFLSVSYDGAIFSQEVTVNYSTPGDYGARFIARRLGNVNNFFCYRLRWVNTSRMAFSRAILNYG